MYNHSCTVICYLVFNTKMLRYQYHKKPILFYLYMFNANFSVTKNTLIRKEKKGKVTTVIEGDCQLKARTIKTHTILQSKQFCNTITDSNTNMSKSIRLHNCNNTRHDKSDHYQQCVHVCRIKKPM